MADLLQIIKITFLFLWVLLLGWPNRKYLLMFNKNFLLLDIPIKLDKK